MQQGWSPPPGWQLTPIRPATNGLAVTSLVFGVLWLGGIGAAVAVIAGHAALRDVKRRGDGGFGLAVAGLWLGYLGLAISIGLMVAVRS